MIGYGVASTAFAGLAITMVIRRESGVLKRIRATPLPPWTYLVAVLVSTFITFLVEASLLIVLGRLLFSVAFPARPLSLFLVLVIGAAAFAAMGLGLTGFDPGARRTAWETVRDLRALGKTILLTTHYLDEAEQLADRVAVLRDGLIVREGSPADLTGGVVDTEIRFKRDGRDVVERTQDPTRRLHELTAEALARGEELAELEVRRPTLEDVYLELTAE